MNKEMQEKVEEITKALMTGETGLGGEAMPDEVLNDIIMLVRQKTWLPGAFDEIMMDTEIVSIPKMTSDIEFHRRLKSEGETEISGQSMTTDSVDLKLKTVIAALGIGKKLVAYSIDALMPRIRRGIAEALAEQEEDMVINGDTETTFASNINGVYSVSNPEGVDATHNDRLLEFEGLRKVALSNGITPVDANAGPFVESLLTQAFAKLGRLGRSKDDLLVFVGNSVGNETLRWDSLKTLDKYGPQATILKGELGKLFGSTVIETDAIKENLGIDGKFDPAVSEPVDDRTIILVVNKNVPVVGRSTVAERKFNVEYEDKPRMDGFYLVPKEDMAFTVTRPEGVVAIVNIAPYATP